MSHADSNRLEMEGISKRFGANWALKDVRLHVQKGEVLALLGENGAGKSTLMKILSGAYLPDAGVIRLFGEPLRLTGTLDAIARGVSTIYQELSLAPDLSVEENIYLGREPSAFGFVRRTGSRKRVIEALDSLGHRELSPTTKVRKLPVALRQVVEVARALVHDAKLIVFDEPTSSLPRQDAERLFQVIRRLKQSGIAIVYISHFLEEVRAICDSFVILRDGVNAGSGILAEHPDEELVAGMVGRKVTEMFPKVVHRVGDEVLKVQDLRGSPLPKSANLVLRRGEILGISGLVGAGRTETLRCLLGLDRIQSGIVILKGSRLAAGAPNRVAAGMGMVSEDRKREGLAQIRSIEDNLTYSNLARYSRYGLLNLKSRSLAVRSWLNQLKIRSRTTRQTISTLSGGNQQKVALARLLHQDAEILLLDEPTKGIDVGTKAEIYRMIGELAAAGKSVILVSSYLPELLAICDRIAVISRGQVREVRPVGDWNEHSLMTVAIQSDFSLKSDAS